MVRIRGRVLIIINIRLSDNLFQLQVHNMWVGLRRCGHMCVRKTGEYMVASGCIECNTTQHAPDCIVCALLNKKGG